MPSSEIAPELLDTIIDYLHDEKSALCACSLVCRTWLPSSRYHLFSSLSLTPYNIDTTIEILNTPASTVPPYVRFLTIQEGRGGQDTKWLSASLPKVPISRMTAVQDLSLREVQWYALGEEERLKLTTLARSVQTLSLNYFKFETLAQALELFSAAPSLEGLTLTAVTFIDEDDSSPVEQYTALRLLRTLELGSSPKSLLIDWLLVQQPIPNIRTVTLKMVTTEETPSISACLARLGPALEHLQLGFFNYDPAAGESEAAFCRDADLAHNTSLRSIAFDNLVLYGGSQTSIISGFIMDVLSQVTSQHMEQVTFRVWLSAPEELHLLALPRLASVFAQNPRFSQSTRVLFVTHGDVDMGETHAWIKERLTALGASGRLLIE